MRLTVSHVPPSLKSGDIVYNNLSEGDRGPFYVTEREGCTFELRRLTWQERLRHSLSMAWVRLDLWLMFKWRAIGRAVGWAWLWLRAVNPFDPLFTLEDFRKLRGLSK